MSFEDQVAADLLRLRNAEHDDMPLLRHRADSHDYSVDIDMPEPLGPGDFPLEPVDDASIDTVDYPLPPHFIADDASFSRPPVDDVVHRHSPLEQLLVVGGNRFSASDEQLIKSAKGVTDRYAKQAMRLMKRFAKTLATDEGLRDLAVPVGDDSCAFVTFAAGDKTAAKKGKINSAFLLVVLKWKKQDGCEYQPSSMATMIKTMFGELKRNGCLYNPDDFKYQGGFTSVFEKRCSELAAMPANGDYGTKPNTGELSLLVSFIFDIPFPS